MELTLELNKTQKKARIVFASKNDLGFVDVWRKALGDELNQRMRDAVEFAQLAIYRYEAHGDFQPYAKNIVDVADHISTDPQIEVAGLVLMICDWFPLSKVIGVCHFRRTWSNSIILDYLASHPFIKRPPHVVRGVGLGFLYFLAQFAKRYDCEAIWGEATPNSYEYYQDQFKLDLVRDLIFVPREKYNAFLERPEIKQLEWKGVLTSTSPQLAMVYEMEDKHSPLVGNKTAVFNPARRLAYRFLDLPDHVQTGIAQTLGLVQTGDEIQPLAEQFRRYFQRASATGKLPELWREVEKRYPDGEPGVNPFPSGE